MQICSVNIGKAGWIECEGKRVLSAITKIPTKDKVFLSVLGLQGDEQANKIRHGGLDKAVCAYPEEYYDDWEQELCMELPFGSFGENLTVRGMREPEVHIGDIFMWGRRCLRLPSPAPHVISWLKSLATLSCRFFFKIWGEPVFSCVF